MGVQPISFFSFLLTYSFWSRLGFFISYTATFFIVLEVFRLVYSDSTKREAQRLLDSYTKQRNGSPRRRTEDLQKVSIEALERPSSPRKKRTAVTPTSEKALVEERRRRRGHSSAANISPPVNNAVPPMTTNTTAPPRRLRKRSETLNSAGSATEHRTEARNLFKLRRSASPASDVASKSSSRQGSPLRKIKKEKDTSGLAVGSTKIGRSKV